MRGDEERVEHSTSFRNVPEALVVAQTVARLVAAGVAADSIGVVSPYSSQVYTYADGCGRMRTYADVCGRMLTYADVC